MIKQAINTPFKHSIIANPTNTTWVNPSQEHTANFNLLTNQPSGIKGTGRAWIQVTIKPGEEQVLPSVYDSAIRGLDKSGTMVISGKCPWLLKKGEEPLPLHPALDFEKVIEKQSLLQLQKQLEEEKATQEAKELYQEIKKNKGGRPRKNS